MRSAVSRTAKGYSIEATLDMGDKDSGLITEGGEPMYRLLGQDEAGATVQWLSAFQIAELQKHMKALGAAFPREDV